MLHVIKLTTTKNDIIIIITMATTPSNVNNPPLPSREVLEGRITGMYSTYPRDWELDFDYSLDFGASDVYSDSVMVEILLHLLTEIGIGEDRAKNLANALVKEGSIIMGENRMVQFIDHGRNICNLGAEEMFFIQFITTTGWKLSGFGGEGVWWGELDTFCLVKYSTSPAINRINDAIKMSNSGGGEGHANIRLFGEDIGKELFRGMVP